MITLHEGDLPADLDFGTSVAIDTETMGLVPQRDRLCLLQISSGDGNAHLVRFSGNDYAAPNLKKILNDTSVQKIFHYARFDIGIMKAYLGVDCRNIFCTKTASRLCRTYTDKHSLKALCSEVLGIELDKASQTSDWGADTLSQSQQAYAASDVLYLHKLRDALIIRLKRENRMELAQACFDFLPYRAQLDLTGWPDFDIFAH